ncbi:MAG: glycosyltransferase family 2 protein [Flavobacteriales bacterium]|nr:glycosyltransferase family 2 protein [Flavobacteriales bacterium]
MTFSLIICTYMRPAPIIELLESIRNQTVYPTEIIIVDGSTNNETEMLLVKSAYVGLKYFRVEDKDRGLTKQRNFGINMVDESIDIISFLDDDTIADKSYFKELINTYSIYPEALGVGGYISNDSEWVKVEEGYKPTLHEFYNDGYKTIEGSRFVLRKRLGLDSDVPCGFLPEFSHGRSVSFLPPSGKIYEVEQLMGGVSSFRKEIFDKIQFSTYFEGYGLYEDADFTLRLSKMGKLYINTKALVGHYHDEGGRPNKYKYGKMVVVNGWYVWRVKHPRPSFKAKIKWSLITHLLIFIRFTNVFTSNKRREAWQETLGRLAGCVQLIFRKPVIK